MPCTAVGSRTHRRQLGRPQRLWVSGDPHTLQQPGVTLGILQRPQGGGSRQDTTARQGGLEAPGVQRGKNQLLRGLQPGNLIHHSFSIQTLPLLHPQTPSTTTPALGSLVEDVTLTTGPCFSDPVPCQAAVRQGQGLLYSKLHPIPCPLLQRRSVSAAPEISHTLSPVCQQQRWGAGEFVAIFNKEYNKSEEGDKGSHQDHRLGMPLVPVLGADAEPRTAPARAVSVPTAVPALSWHRP